MNDTYKISPISVLDILALGRQGFGVIGIFPSVCVEGGSNDGVGVTLASLGDRCLNEVNGQCSMLKVRWMLSGNALPCEVWS